LEKRGWLIRRGSKKPARYVAGLDQEKTAALLAGRFADDFFGGSASELVMSLLGSGKFSTDEVQRLRRLLESACSDRNAKEGEQP
jgi:predicted transcriptional regulator